jgi:hypothetical protein
VIVLPQTDRLVMESCLFVAEDAPGTTFASLRTTISASHSYLPSWNDSRHAWITIEDECNASVLYAMVFCEKEFIKVSSRYSRLVREMNPGASFNWYHVYMQYKRLDAIYPAYT